MENQEGPGWEMQQQLEEQEYFFTSHNMTYTHNLMHFSHNCRCSAYPFPHRPLGGRCKGDELCERAFEDGSECEGCDYHYENKEFHPYGETVAAEDLHDCLAIAAQCPVVQAASNQRRSK